MHQNLWGTKKERYAFKYYTKKEESLTMNNSSIKSKILGGKQKQKKQKIIKTEAGIHEIKTTN